jgi:hypothetical protein
MFLPRCAGGAMSLCLVQKTLLSILEKSQLRCTHAGGLRYGWVAVVRSRLMMRFSGLLDIH